MDEAMKERFSGYLDALEASTKNAGDFMSQEAPEVAKEYISWYLLSHGVEATVFAAMLLASIAGAVYLWRARQKVGSDIVCLGILTVMPLVIFSVCTIVSTMAVVKGIVAPRVVILEKVSRIVSGN